MSNVEVYTSGLVCCSVCAPKDMSIEDVTSAVNRQHPTGISSQWRLSDDKIFKGGEPNPCPCEGNPERIHYLFNC